MFLMANSEPTQNSASYRVFRTTFTFFPGFYISIAVPGQKQFFAVHLKTDHFQTEPKVPSKRACSKVHTVKWNLIFFDFWCPTPFVSECLVIVYLVS